jgi:hypothetical protein
MQICNCLNITRINNTCEINIKISPKENKTETDVLFKCLLEEASGREEAAIRFKSKSYKERTKSPACGA